MMPIKPTLNRVFLLLPILVPFFIYVLPIEEPYEYQLFYLVFAALLGVTGAAVMSSKESPKVYLSPPDVAVLLFYAVAITSSVINGDSLVNHEGIKLVSALVVLYFVVKILLLRNGSIDQALIRFLLWAIVSLGALESLIGILQNYSIDLFGRSGVFRVVGTFYNPNQFASFIAPSIPLGIALYLSEKKSTYKKSSLALILTIVR